jgi:NAD(P)H-hydrate epimerase
VGEFIRIAELDKAIFEADQIGCLEAFVAKYKAKVLLKSFTTIYMDEDKTIFSIAGNDGLATGGSGDVLSGIIVSFAAQKMSLGPAAISASYLMGITAEHIAQKRSTPSIIPSDIIENLFLKENDHA